MTELSYQWFLPLWDGLKKDRLGGVKWQVQGGQLPSPGCGDWKASFTQT